MDNMNEDDIPEPVKMLMKMLGAKMITGMIGVHAPGCDEDHDNNSDTDCDDWVQVGKLSGAEMLKRKKLERSMLMSQHKLSVLKAQASKLAADAKVDQKKWWSELYASHSLPTGNYHITDDGRLLMEPKRKKGEGKKADA